MNKRIKQLAKQAGFEFDAECVEGWIADDEHLKRFAELVRQDEREACAKLCEKVHDDYINDRNNDGYDWPDGHNCAEAIRARSQA